MTISLRPILIVLAGLLVPALAFSQRHVERTGFIREMAKCDTDVILVESGSGAHRAAQNLISLIQEQREFNNKKTVECISADSLSARTLRVKQGHEPTVIVVWNRADSMLIPPAVGTLFPREEVNREGNLCRISARITRSKAGDIALAVFIEGSNEDELDDLANRFSSETFANWRDMRMDRTIRVNRVFVRASGIPQETIAKWGIRGADSINTVRFDKGSEPVPSGFDEVFIWDRSNKSTQMPPEVATVIHTDELGPLTMLATKQTQADGHQIAVLAAPDLHLLTHLITRFPNFEAIDPSGFRRDAVDLRPAKRTVVVVNAATGDKDVVEGVRSLVETDLRAKGHLNVLQRGPGLEKLESEVQLQQTHGAEDVSNRLRSKYGVRWVFLLDVTDVSGQTQYHTQEEKATPSSDKYPIFPPSEPVRHPLFGHAMNDEEWARAQEKYHKDLDQYNQDKEKYENEDQVMWRRQVIRVGTARAHLIFKLVDLEGEVGKVLWESEKDADAAETSTHRSETITVKGHATQADSLDCPPSEPICSPALQKEASRNAASQAINLLLEESLLPTQNGIRVEALVDPAIIAIDGPLVTINVGTAQGVKAGDRVITTIYRQVLDPDTHEVIERVAVEKSTLLVVRVGKTSDCRATTAKELNRLGKLKVGDAVEIEHAQ